MTGNMHQGQAEREIVLAAVGDAEPIYCETLHDVRVTGEGHLFRRFWPLKDHDKLSLSARILGLRWSSLRDAYRRSALSLFRPVRQESEAFWVTDRESGNYWHWFFEVLPKLQIIAKRDPAKLVLLPNWLEQRDYVQQSIEFLGLENVFFIPKRRSIYVRRLSAMSKSHYHPEVISGARELVLPHFTSVDGPPLVYISRNDADKRRVVNETSDLLPLLGTYGFQTLEMSKLTFQQQVESMLDCKVLVSMHGAGLTNMLFMPKGGTVIEFRTDNPCFVKLAGFLGLRHIAIRGTKASERSDHHADWKIDPADLQSALNECLSSSNAPASAASR